MTSDGTSGGTDNTSVAAKAGRDKVETIIKEEVKHVADLRRQLTDLDA